MTLGIRVCATIAGALLSLLLAAAADAMPGMPGMGGGDMGGGKSAGAATPLAGGTYSGRTPTGSRIKVSISRSAPDGMVSGRVRLPCAKATARFDTEDGVFEARSRKRAMGMAALQVRGRFTALDEVRGKVLMAMGGGSDCMPGRFSAKLQRPSGITSTTLSYGPFDLAAADPASGETMGTFATGDIAKPCDGCSIVGIEPQLTYANGKSANMNTGAMLHHAVLFNTARRDASCTSWPQRFFATGNERTPMMLPRGYGYEVGGGDRWRLLTELMNMDTGKAQSLYVTLKYYFAPASAGLQPVSPLWLDVNNCSSSQYSIPAGRSDTDWDFMVPQEAAGRIVSIAGHQHDTGVRITTENVTKGETICDSRAGYGDDPAYMGAIESMSGCVGVPLARIDGGDLLRLHSIYDSPEPQDDVMGISVAYVAP